MSPGTKKEMPIVQVDHQRAGRGKLTSGLKKAARGQGRALGGQSCVVAPTGRSSRQEMDGAPPGVPVCISGRDGGGMTVEPLQHSLPQMRMGPGVGGAELVGANFMVTESTDKVGGVQQTQLSLDLPWALHKLSKNLSTSYPLSTSLFLKSQNPLSPPAPS